MTSQIVDAKLFDSLKPDDVEDFAFFVASVSDNLSREGGLHRHHSLYAGDDQSLERRRSLRSYKTAHDHIPPVHSLPLDREGHVASPFCVADLQPPPSSAKQLLDDLSRDGFTHETNDRCAALCVNGSKLSQEVPVVKNFVGAFLSVWEAWRRVLSFSSMPHTIARAAADIPKNSAFKPGEVNMFFHVPTKRKRRGDGHDWVEVRFLPGLVSTIWLNKLADVRTSQYLMARREAWRSWSWFLTRTSPRRPWAAIRRGVVCISADASRSSPLASGPLASRRHAGNS